KDLITHETAIDYFNQNPNDYFDHQNMSIHYNIFSYIRCTDIHSLAAILKNLNDEEKKKILQMRDCYDSNILHIVAATGSLPYLKLIIQTMGDNIKELYSHQNAFKMTPAMYVVIKGSLDCLRTILQISPLPLEKELFDSNGIPSALVKMIMISNDLNKIQFILNISDKYSAAIGKWYANSVEGPDTIIYGKNHSAANFFMLQQYAEFNKDCAFIKKFLREKNKSYSFSAYGTLHMHIHKLEQLQQKNLRK
ncbi:MAG: hypothetical protein JO149_08795, partial [Gammaproteobacteria bacterium]|nr:hypothetical protein [Gammaproteobacteria bacterium]